MWFYNQIWLKESSSYYYKDDSYFAYITKFIF